jgi:hypothetical protein
LSSLLFAVTEQAGDEPPGRSVSDRVRLSSIESASKTSLTGTGLGVPNSHRKVGQFSTAEASEAQEDSTARMPSVSKCGSRNTSIG